jgi:hypothetical protein
MEIALPLLGLGAMYVISNQNSEKETYKTIKNKDIKRRRNDESFVNMGQTTQKQNQYLPNTNIPPSNYPVANIPELLDNVAEYPNPNIATDKYFNQNLYKNHVERGVRVDSSMPQVYSMTGNYLDSKEFKHNNMVPFYGGKIKGYTYDMNIAETVLDNMVGSGSQVIKKIEQAPLFKPEDNVQWAFGAPNNSDFYQSRVNPAMKNNNVKPFDTERVAPGLGLGFTTAGSGGFNSGMALRDEWLPKTVDQLRVATNPKLEYSLENLEGPANAEIKNLGIIGRVEKNRPDRFFMNTQDRWFTTTGAEKGETLRPIQEMGQIRRPDIDINYTGPAGQGENNANYVAPAFEESRRNTYGSLDVGHSNAVRKGPSNDGDMYLGSYTHYNNNRTVNPQVDTMRSGFSSAIGAVIAPLMDILRPSRKEELVNNVRIYGDRISSVPANYVINPNDTTQTTVKETTLFAPQFNINNQKGEYVNNQLPLNATIRQCTEGEYTGTPGGASTGWGNRNNNAEYRQHNNDIKSSAIAYNYTAQGGTNLFNQQMNVSTMRADNDRFNNRIFTPGPTLVKKPPSAENYGVMTFKNTLDETQGCTRNSSYVLSALKENPYTHSFTSL